MRARDDGQNGELWGQRKLWLLVRRKERNVWDALFDTAFRVGNAQDFFYENKKSQPGRVSIKRV